VQKQPELLGPENVDLWKLTRRAEAGDAEARAELAGWLQRPAVVERWGDIARVARDKLIAVHCRDVPLVREAVQRKVKALQVELVGEHPSAVEGLLAGRVVADWLFLSLLEMLYAVRLPDMPPELVVYYERRLVWAERRYLSALRGLVQVRKLLGRPLDVAGQADDLAPSQAALPGRRAANAAG
jgi:hypothetical protein